MKIYFSEFFGIDHNIVEKYGALDISLVADMPVFIDPFSLFASEKKEYNDLHEGIVNYLRYLRDIADKPISKIPGVIKELFAFPEFPYTYMGFCESGSSGHGLGFRFGKTLRDNISEILGSFEAGQVSETSHLEKLCIISKGVGVDCISDFTTNLIKDFLLRYTQTFALKYLKERQRAEFHINHACFDFKKRSWKRDSYILPKWRDNYVVLVPKDILTKDDTWINKEGLVHDLRCIPDFIGNEELKGRFMVLLHDILDEKRKYTVAQKNEKIIQFCKEYPEAIDWYIKKQEGRKEEARAHIGVGIDAVNSCLYDFQLLARRSLEDKGFYGLPKTSLDEVLAKARLFQHAIEDCDVYKVFYDKTGKRISEKMVQLMFKLVWLDSDWDVNAEVNNGCGPADFVVSFGAKDKCIVEVKLASNTHLERNLCNQLDVYKGANSTKHGIYIIVFTDDKEEKRMNDILTRLGLITSPYIIGIDARPNKISASLR